MDLCDDGYMNGAHSHRMILYNIVGSACLARLFLAVSTTWTFFCVMIFGRNVDGSTYRFEQGDHATELQGRLYYTENFVGIV